MNAPVRYFDTALGDRVLGAADVQQLTNDSADALVAAGTNAATALALTAHVNHVATAALGTGVVLPTMVANDVRVVINDGANPIKVYASAGTVDGVAAATGVTLTNAKRAIFFCVAAGVIVSISGGASA